MRRAPYPSAAQAALVADPATRQTDRVVASAISDRHLAEFDEGTIDTILGEDVEFTGELSFERSLIIKGDLNGKITVSGTLYVDEHATVSARVEVERLRCKGRVDGDVIARRGVELYSTANVTGDVATPVLVMESGSKLNGRCVMGGDQRSSDQGSGGQGSGNGDAKLPAGAT